MLKRTKLYSMGDNLNQKYIFKKNLASFAALSLFILEQDLPKILVGNSFSLSDDADVGQVGDKDMKCVTER